VKRFCGLALVVSALVALVPGRPALAGSGPDGPPAERVESEGAWRRYALPASLVGAGLGLATAGIFFHVAQSRVAEFNALTDNDMKICGVGKVGFGGPRCQMLYDGSESASRWRNIGLGAAGAFAIAAVVLKLTEPAAQEVAGARERAGRRGVPFALACAPGFGLSGSCSFSF
jgi:hypothetical protein